MTRALTFALFFWALCPSRLVVADDAASIPAATPQQVHQTVDRAIGYLQTESAAWLNTRKCAACHHAAMPLWALSEAERQGYAIDKKFVTETAEAILGGPDKLISSKLVPGPNDPPDTRPLASGVRTGTVFMAVAARALPSLTDGQKESLRQITDEILKKQRDDGSWEFFLSRPPINESQTSDHAWIIMALPGENDPNLSESQRVALAKALAWQDSAVTPGNPQDKALKLLVALRRGKLRGELQTAIDELLALQHADGGWGQLPDSPSDAYATGQALYVLALAGYSIEQPEIQRSVDMLVARQQPDGSWLMTSRSTPDGSPGSSKLLTPISCAAAAWATLGLSRLAPQRP